MSFSSVEKTPIKGSTDQYNRKSTQQMTVIVVALVFATTGIIFTGSIPVYAQATTSTVQVIVPLDSVTTNTCNGEAVYLSGNENIVEHVTQDASGGVHIVNGHSNFQGATGVGDTTGTKYIFAHAGSPIFNIRQDSANEFTFLANGRLISQGGEPNQLGTAQIHQTFNANGEITAEIISFTLKCT
jgi:hypothetical protein